MKILSIQSFNSKNNSKLKNDNSGSSTTNSIKNSFNYFPNFGVGMRSALIESIAEGKKILELSSDSYELRDMAERFHTCPDIIIKRISAVYEWASAWALLALKDYNEVKSQQAYQKLSGAIRKVINSKSTMSSSELERLNNKARECYEQYEYYSRL